MNYLETDLLRDKFKFLRNQRCNKCQFRLSSINNKTVCLWCLGEEKIKHTVLYGPYNGKTHAYVLQNDFNYCLERLENNPDTKLAYLTKKFIA